MSKAERKRESWPERRREIKHKWAVPFIFAEWICKVLSDFLKRWAFLDILKYAGWLAILFALIFYFLEADERRMQSTNLQMLADNVKLQLDYQKKAKQYQAWQVISVAQGQRSSAGRIEALQDLNRDKTSLAGVDLSNACLPSLFLPGANLSGANFCNADLPGANLSGADLTDANLVDANLAGADLSGVDLTSVKLSGANLSNAYLRKADLSGVHLKNVDLRGAKLKEAKLSGADFSGVSLLYASLANITGWENIQSIRYANVHGVMNNPKGFLEWATAPEQGAVSIDNDDEWKKFVSEKKKQEVEYGGKNQKNGR